jgi:5-methylthioadenosine/S-adenosylhomocysteine deaminase
VGELQIVEAGWVVTMDAGLRVVPRGAVLIDDDRIVGVGPAADFRSVDALRHSFPRHVLLPGLVNGHTHVAGSLFRGLLEDRTNHFYGYALPMEPYMDADAIYELSLLGIAELVLSGCTVMNDMFHYAAETARAVQEIGIRAQIAHKVFDVDLPGIGEGRRDFDLDAGIQRLADNISLYDQWHGAADGRIQIRFGLHASDTCSPELMARIVAEARSRGAGIHTHTAQSNMEDAFIRGRYGYGCVEHLDRNDVLGPDTIAVHLLWADDAGVAALARTGTKVAHCPACVSKATGRIGPFQAIYEAGITVGWGTDWVTMDPWDAMRFGIIGYRLTFGDETSLTAHKKLLTARDALWRFTMGSAKMLGIDDQVGSLEEGKKADLILVDADQPHLAPLYDPIAVLVYNGSGRDVTHVMVDGQFVVSDRKLAGADVGQIIERAQRTAERVWQAGSSPEGMLLDKPTFVAVE